MSKPETDIIAKYLHGPTIHEGWPRVIPSRKNTELLDNSAELETVGQETGGSDQQVVEPIIDQHTPSVPQEENLSASE